MSLHDVENMCIHKLFNICSPAWFLSVFVDMFMGEMEHGCFFSACLTLQNLWTCCYMRDLAPYPMTQVLPNLHRFALYHSTISTEQSLNTGLFNFFPFKESFSDVDLTDLNQWPPKTLISVFNGFEIFWRAICFCWVRWDTPNFCPVSCSNMSFTNEFPCAKTACFFPFFLLFTQVSFRWFSDPLAVEQTMLGSHHCVIDLWCFFVAWNRGNRSN